MRIRVWSNLTPASGPSDIGPFRSRTDEFEENIESATGLLKTTRFGYQNRGDVAVSSSSRHWRHQANSNR